MKWNDRLTKQGTSFLSGSINCSRFTSQNHWTWRLNFSCWTLPTIRSRRLKCTTIYASQTNWSGPIWNTLQVGILLLLNQTTTHSLANIDWLKNFLNSTDHMAFVNRLNTYTRARFLSLDRMPGMDRTSDCWVVMAYNSTRQLESKRPFKWHLPSNTLF